MEARQKLEKQLAKEAPRDHLGNQSLGLPGKENGYYIILGYAGIMEKKMETTIMGLYRV